MRRCFLIMLVGCVLFIGCGSDKNKSSDLAIVNNKPITNEEFDAYLKFKRTPAKDEKLYNSILDQYIEREALASVIETEKVLDNLLLQAELNEFRKEMMISRYFEKFLNEKVTEQTIQNYYNTHANDFDERKAHAAHILIRTNPKMTEPERKVKLTTAQEAYSQIKTGKDFASVAKDYSEDKISVKKGGDLGWIKEGTIDAHFSKTVFELKPGSVSEPFETPFGFHIVKLLEGPQIIKKPLKTVAGDIRYQLRNQAKKTEVDRLMAKTKVVKYNK
ncbi:MAG: peptidylprolyl isomerase [Desulfobacterales bacterium]|nr:peptidylprolyl isomerase [Desulfobacterales bacterium]MBF0395899.1 peptidylprolyl isomerase [Desulfobacterales bacterium]